MNLFLDQLPDEMEKEAGYISRLSENVETWPQELTNDIFKQLPFLSDYEVTINLDKVEPQRGFAFGFADITNKTERPEAEHADAGIPHIRIPIVIIERAVKPFSIFLDGDKVFPMTEERVREVLFNPNTFDLSVSQPRDPSLVEPLMPPTRSGIGMGGEYKMASINDLTPEQRKQYEKGLKYIVDDAYKNKKVVGAKKGEKSPFEKEFQKKSSLLKAIAPTIKQEDIEAFTEKVASDPTIIAGFKRSGVGSLLVNIFESTEKVSHVEKLAALAASIEPTVVTIQKLPGGEFLIKSANTDAFAGGQQAQGEVVDQQAAGDAIGQDNAQAMQPGQTATAVTDPVQQMDPMQSKAKPVQEFGQYNVQDTIGNTIMGHVFPTVLSWDGSFSPEPMMLFTNGGIYALQDAIAGELVGKSAVLPNDKPIGDGCFYSTDGGNATCTVPLTIGSTMAGPDGLPRFNGTDAFGNPLSISYVDGIKNPERISDVEYAFPSNWKFLRLNNQTQLMGDPGAVAKTAAVRAERQSVTLFYNGAYNLTGGCGIDKVATDLRYDLDSVSAEFMLGVLGVDGLVAKQKIAEARKKGSVKLAGLKTITTLAERFQTQVKEASAFLATVPNLKQDLIKEAAKMRDEGTIDHVLALNFINPENLGIFVGYLPELEETSEKLAEMLLSSYLGMDELPEADIQRTVKGLENVIVGLRAIAHAES